MPVTVGDTSPLPGASRTKDRARQKAGAAARLSAVLSGAVGAAAVAASAAPCRAVGPQPGKPRPAHSVHSSCGSDGVHVPFALYPLKHPCLSKAYEAAEEALAAERQLWAERHAAAVSEQGSVLPVHCPPLSAAHTMAVAALDNCTADGERAGGPRPLTLILTLTLAPAPPPSPSPQHPPQHPSTQPKPRPLTRCRRAWRRRRR